MYTPPIDSKHENKSLFQNLATDIVEVQTLRGIILLGGDFNARTTGLIKPGILFLDANFARINFAEVP